MTRRPPARSSLTPALLVALAWAGTAALHAGCQAQAPAAGSRPTSAHAPARDHAVETSPEDAPKPRPISIDEAIEALGDSPIATILDHLGDDAKAFNTHVITLSNPFFEGRQPGTRGNALAADYIERVFREAKLRPAFASETVAPDGSTVLTPGATYRQSFRAGSKERVLRQMVAVGAGREKPRELRPDRDFVPLGCTADGTVTGPVVFVGYSITDGKDGYSSFAADTDLTGKIALILRFEPMTEDGKSRWADSGWSPSASLDAKVKAALDRNAAGIILVNPPGAADPRSRQLPDRQQTRLDTECAVPAVFLSADAGAALVGSGDPAGPSLEDLRRRADGAGGVADLPGVVATLDTALVREATMTDNVGGILPGRGALADEFVIIGSHFDHVGVGPIGASPENFGKMHPGADDNASGTSGMLVLADKFARAYAQAPADQPARSMLFIGFSAEEAGLIGSKYFVEHSPIDRSKMYAMLNLDMIGRLREGKIEIGGVGTAPGFRDWLKPYFDQSGLAIKPTASGFGPSDHASFAAAKVPVLFFFTQLHREYHTPADVGSTINQKGAARVIGLAESLALALATRPDPLRPSGGDRAGAEPEPAQPLNAGPVRVKVRFGIAPGDYSGEEPGVLVGDVYEGTSAAEAGITKDDLINSWNGTPVKSVEAWMPLLAGANPGDVVEIGLIREGKPMTIKVTLKGRDQGGR